MTENATETEIEAKTKPQPTMRNLRVWNIVVGFAHLIQGILIVVLSNDFALPITASYMSGPPGAPLQEPVVLLDTPLGWGVALFFFLSAFFHFLVSLPGVYERYSNGLLARHNYYRWVEYSVSSSVMIVLIAQIIGISDAAALIAIFGVNASMILFGWVQEKYVKPGNGDMLPFAFGSFAGSVPWLIFLLYLIAPNNTLNEQAPAFVYAIVVTIFLLFNCFAIVQWLQYKKKPINYVRGEKAYIVLSLVAKSALAWQIFANTLIPPA